MNRLDDLEAFAAVVETGSFTRAAERLGLAKSAISRRVSALESRLGVELLRRTTRRLDLTDTGRGFYERSARILADLDEAEAAAAQSHGELSGTLKVALPLSFGVRHMCAPIAEFSRRHPGIRFELDLNDRRVDLLEEGADLALRIGRLQDSSLIARRLFDARTALVAAPDYLSRFGIPSTPAELERHRCLIYSNLPEPRRWVCRDADGETVAVTVSPVMSASSGDFLARQAVEGQGIAMQPSFIVGDAIADGRLVSLLEDYAWPVTPAYAVYPPTRHLSYRVRAFIDFLVENFSGTPSWDQGRSAAAR
ncbi:MAG: LysR family transcriptional regulator [Pseudomonadota bacterium]